MNPTNYFFQEDVIAQKTRMSIIFSYQNQMEWIKSFHGEKNIIYEEKKFQEKNLNLKKKFPWGPLSPFLSIFGHNFFSRATIEKENYTPMSLIIFSIFKKVSKNHDKNSAYRYLSEIPFVPQIDNDPLGVIHKEVYIEFIHNPLYSLIKCLTS